MRLATLHSSLSEAIGDTKWNNSRAAGVINDIDMPRKDVADALGVNKSTVTRLCADPNSGDKHRDPSLKMLKKMKRKLGQPVVNAFLGGSNESRKG